MTRNDKGTLYLVLAIVLAALIAYLWWKHRQLAQQIGLGQIQTTPAAIGATLIAPSLPTLTGAPL